MFLADCDVYNEFALTRNTVKRVHLVQVQYVILDMDNHACNQEGLICIHRGTMAKCVMLVFVHILLLLSQTFVKQR